MGYVEIIKDGVMAEIGKGAHWRVQAVEMCDDCNEFKASTGGKAIRDDGGEIVLWICADCR